MSAPLLTFKINAPDKTTCNGLCVQPSGVNKHPIETRVCELIRTVARSADKFQSFLFLFLSVLGYFLYAIGTSFFWSKKIEWVTIVILIDIFYGKFHEFKDVTTVN